MFRLHKHDLHEPLAAPRREPVATNTAKGHDDMMVCQSDEKLPRASESSDTLRITERHTLSGHKN